MPRPTAPNTADFFRRRRTRTYDPSTQTTLLGLIVDYMVSPYVSGWYVGDLRFTLSTTVPDGWLLCDGSAFDPVVYPELAAELGAATLPNMQGRYLRGAGAGGVGQTGGNNQVTLTVAQLPAHDHAVTDPGHTHAVTDPGHGHGTGVGTGVDGAAGVGAGADTETTGISVDNAATGIAVQNTGGGDPVNIEPEYITANWMVKT